MHVLVTGATRGLGRAIVEGVVARSSDEDAHVIFLGCRDESAGIALASLLTLASSLPPSNAARIIPLVLDVTDPASVTAAAARVATEMAGEKRLDALVNNAGVLLEREGCPMADVVEPSLKVNLDGAVAATDAFLPLLRDGGQIINVSSGAGTRATGALSDATRAELEAADAAALRTTITRLAHEAAANGAPPPGETPVYALSKVALNYYTRLVARHAPHLRVNACSPGFCRTDIAGADVTYTREPKDARLGADVVLKLLFGEIGADATDSFFKECSKPGTPLGEAHSAAEPWAVLVK